jgi:hypothetical protein
MGMKKMKLSPSNKTFIVSLILVITGILTGGLLHPYFYLIAGLGLFGPGLLRELSILNDQDDFQRASSRKAGNMAFLITGFILLLVICLKTAGKFEGVEGPCRPAPGIRHGAVSPLLISFARNKMASLCPPPPHPSEHLLFTLFSPVFNLHSTVGKTHSHHISRTSPFH